ncbi:DUF3895 domain-containing protein [Heyndrickxia camelliae]|uniref:DUF3895 domain-containing protein n=1 Tax=Heyndrickxia camelliae TaxID=1707093 RepID=UPI001F22064A|nr:DUF3895 domain-containing protein [Heyndrickxia camelliae]
MRYQLGARERERLLESLPLTDEQRDFLIHHVKRGKKTIFANIMAKDKGIVLPGQTTNEEIEQLLDEWILDDYIDNGFVNPETRCECGRPLRYQYIVRHKTTNEKRRFGIDHFEEHTNISSTIIKDILKGFHTIDYELDELLVKISENWSLSEVVPYLPNEFKLSEGIKQYIDNDIPLLDRQIELLKKEIRLFVNQPQRLIDIVPSNVEKSLERQENDQISFDFGIDDSIHEVATTLDNNNVQINLGLTLEDQIFQFVQEGISSARVICELLIKHEQVFSVRYITGKPKIFVRVCQYLDSLVDQGIIKNREILGTDDRIYNI